MLSIDSLVFVHHEFLGKSIKAVHHNNAYSALEEWLHCLQRQCGSYLSNKFKNENYPTSCRSEPPLEEADIAQFLIENKIPLPRGFLQIYKARAKFCDTDKIVWSDYPLL